MVSARGIAGRFGRTGNATENVRGQAFIAVVVLRVRKKKNYVEPGYERCCEARL